MPIIKNCSWCDKPNEYEPNRVRNNKIGHWFCGHQCSGKWRKINWKQPEAYCNRTDSYEVMPCASCYKPLLRIKPLPNFAFCSSDCKFEFLKYSLNTHQLIYGKNLGSKILDTKLLDDFVIGIKGETNDKKRRMRGYLNRRVSKTTTLECISEC